MTPTLRQLLAVPAFVFGVSACHSTLSGGPVRHDPVAEPHPAVTMPDLAPRDQTTQPSSGQREFCRGQRLPKGWIAVDYTEAPKVCPPQSSESEQYTGAITVRYDIMVEETELFVCTGQQIPRGWIRRQLPDTTSAGTRCPTSRRDVPATKRVMLIKRLT
jgi:hypothetical protein